MAVYPRKQTVVIFILCAFAVGGAASYVFGQNSAVSTGSEQASSVIADVSASADPANVSGNTDWQKQFIDSKDSASTFKTQTAPTVSASKEDLTPIDTLGREFLTSYAQLRQSGLTSDPQAVSNALMQVISKSASGLPSPKIYASNDVNVTVDSSAARNAYGKVIDSIVSMYTTKGDDASIAADALANEDMSILVGIDPIIATYQSMIDRLTSASVPQPFLEHHLNLMNALSVLLYSAKAFRHVDTDALQGLAAVRLNAIGFQNVDTAFADIHNDFKSAL